MTENRRALGTPTLSALVIANMIGAGVFTTSGFALADLGSPDLVMLAWVAGGVMAILGALCYGALAARWTESGGEYLFLTRTLHPFLGFLAGWVSLWAGFTGAIAFAAEATQTYCAPWLPESLAPDFVGTFVLLAIGALHATGLGPAKWIQNLAVSAKLLLLIALVAIGWSQLPERPESPAASFESGSFAITLMWVSLSYSGWNAAVYIAGEARDPKRTLPRALIIGTVVVTALYLALNWIFVYAAPIEQLAGQQDIAAVAANALGGPALESMVRVILVIALCTSISSMVMIGPRVVAKMADDGVFPRQFVFTGRVPRASIWLQVILAIVVLWASDLRAQLTNLGWILSLFTGLSVYGLIRMRMREGAERVPIPAYPFVPFAFLAIVIAMTTTMVWVNSALIWPSLAVLASGALVYGWQRRSHR
ncbi:MAG: amino acid transporter [Planctomycetota bacterium]|jgi:amino acid transporter